MLELCRTIRFCLSDAQPPGQRPPKTNTFSAWPPMRGLGRYYEAVVCCRGEADPVTGYFLNIKHIDGAFREHALPFLEKLLAETDRPGEIALGGVMQQLIERLQPALDSSVISVQLVLSPFYSLEIRSSDMAAVLIKQQYEFSAAHRLHVSELSDEKNREIFGKCNNPSGHGHNYRVEVAASAPINEQGSMLQVEQLDELVDRCVIEVFDHKHLNADLPAFANMNPSVENIAKVIYDMLKSPIKSELSAVLEEVSVWETGKTVCTYRG